MLDLYDFQAEIRHRGTLSPAKFRLRIDLPEGMSTAEQSRQLALRAVTGVFPGRHLMTKDDVVRYGYGPTEKNPWGAQYSDAAFGFVLDTHGDVYKFFDDWQKKIIRSDSSETMFNTQNIVAGGDGLVGQPGDFAPAVGGASSGALPYEVEYKDDYAADILITKTTDLHNNALSCLLFKAYPISIIEIPLDAAQQNSVSLVQIAFSYRDHKIIHHQTNRAFR